MNRLLLHGRHLLIVFLLVFPPLAQGAVRPGAESLVQLAAIAMAALWLASMVRAGRLEVRRTPLDLPIALFLGLAAVSATVSVYPWASRIQLYRLVTYALVFVVLVNTLDSRRAARRLTWIIVLFGAAYAAAALTLADLELLGLEISSRGSHGLSLTFVNRNHFAGYLEMVACLGVGLGLAYRGASRVLLLGLSSCVVLAVLFSLSRGGILALAAGLGFLAVSLVRRRHGRKHAMWLACFLILMLGFAAGLDSGPVLEAVRSLEDPFEAGGTRIEFWRGALDMIAAHPWLGTGPGTFVYAYNRYQTEATARWLVDHAHNDYLELAAEIGVPGLLAGLLGLGVLFILAFPDYSPARRRQESGRRASESSRRVPCPREGPVAACFALAVHSGFTFHAAIPSNVLLFSACAALAVTAGGAAGERWTRVRLAAPWRRPIHAGLLLLSAAGLAAVAAPLLAHRSSRQARAAVEQGRYPEASALLERSIALDPGNGHYPEQLGDLDVGRSMATANPAERQASLVRALAAYEEAIAACPVWSGHFSKQAVALEGLGRIREAEEALIRAARLAPMDPQTHHDLGSFYLRRGSFARGAAEFRRFLELTEGEQPRVLEQLWQARPSYLEVEPAVPHRAEARRGLAAFLFDRGETEGAMKELEAAFALDPTPDGAVLHLRALATRRQHPAALEAGDAYLRRFGALPRLRRQMAELYRQLGRPGRAIQMVEGLLSEQPGNAELYRRLGELQSIAGQPQDAVQTLLSGLEQRPQSAELQASLARLQADLGQLGDALEAWKRAVALEPRTARYRYQLGRAYRRLGLYDHAVTAWQECLRIEPGHRASRQAIARLLEEMDVS